MNLIYFVILSIIFITSGNYGVTSGCEWLREPSGIITYYGKHRRYHKSDYYTKRKCWIINVPHDNYISLELKVMSFSSIVGCTEGYVLFRNRVTDEETVFCPWESFSGKAKSKNAVEVEYYYTKNDGSSFTVMYNIENVICESEDHFRCSRHTCIWNNQTCDGVKDCANGKDETGCESRTCELENHFQCSEDNCITETQVCNGEKDCENGADEIGCGFDISREGVRLSRENAIAWLKEKRSSTFGWGINTHRAVTALYLSGGANFENGDLEEENIMEQLELQTAIALLRNDSSILSVNELSMFINALTVSCHSPRQFYGNDLVKILEGRVQTAKSSRPGPYLTLCNAHWEFSESRIKHVLSFLNMHSGYPFERDIQAMTVMALTCIKNKTANFNKVVNATEMYNSTIKNFIASQHSNGSFGNVYTTALVAQALLSCGQEYATGWNITATVDYLMMKLKSNSLDILTATLVLPVLNGKSLIDVGYRNCNKQKNHVEAKINDVINTVGRKIGIKYSLFIGDDKNVIYSIILKFSESSSAFDLMKAAELSDSKYKFLHTDVSGHMYVYDIAGIANDPEAEIFWQLYIGNADSDGSIIHRNISPDKLILNDKDHIIMWYKAANIPE